MSFPQHEAMTLEEINTCRCEECVRMNAAIEIGVSLAEIGSALEWLPAVSMWATSPDTTTDAPPTEGR